MKVTFKDGTLAIEGERKQQKEEGKGYHRIERSYGSFYRSFAIPEEVEEPNLPKSMERKQKEKAIEVKIR